MKVTIDASGRLVLPKAARRALQIEGAAELEVRVVGSHIEIEAAPAEVTLERRGGFLVAVPKENPSAPLTVEAVEEVRRRLHDEQGAT